MATIYYPSGWNPPGAFSTQPPSVNPAGWDAADGEGATNPRGRVSYQPTSQGLVPGRFSTTNTTFGGDFFGPPRTTGYAAFQPDSPAWPAGAFGTTNTTQGGQAYFPATAAGRKAYHPDSPALPLGQFTTTNTTFGGHVFAPVVTVGRKAFQPDSLVLSPLLVFPAPFWEPETYPDRAAGRRAYQPDSASLPPGRFTTTTTAFGGESFEPVSTRGRTAYQPDPLTWPPGVFVGVTPNVVKGWESYFQAATRGRVSYQPDALSLPTGKFTTTNTTFGGSAYTPATPRSLQPRLQPADQVPWARPSPTAFFVPAVGPLGARGPSRAQPDATTLVSGRPRVETVVDAVFPAGVRARGVSRTPDAGLPPGLFSTTPPVTHPWGWEGVFPVGPSVRAWYPTLPAGYVLVPPISTTPGGPAKRLSAVWARRDLILVWRG